MPKTYKELTSVTLEQIALMDRTTLDALHYELAASQEYIDGMMSHDPHERQRHGPRWAAVQKRIHEFAEADELKAAPMSKQELDEAFVAEGTLDALKMNPHFMAALHDRNNPGHQGAVQQWQHLISVTAPSDRELPPELLKDIPGYAPGLAWANNDQP